MNLAERMVFSMKRSFKQLLALVCTLALLSSFATAFAAANQFTDVPSTYWAHNEIAFVVDKGLFNGTTATQFSPDAQMKRGQLAAVLYRYAGSPEVNNSAENPYADMTNVSSEIKTAILNWAVPAGILGGTTDTTMNPFGAIKRSHVAAMLYRYETKIANPGSVVETPVETTPSTSDKVYTAGDTLVLKQGGTYNVTLGVGETVAIQNQIDEAWSSFDGNKFVDGKRIAEMHWDDSANSLVIEGLAASDVTLQCLSTTDYETVLATINVTVTSGSSTSSGNSGSTGNTGSTSGTLDTTNLDIREEIVRLTNEVRKENGLAALPMDDALMNAAQMAAEEYAKTGSYASGHDVKMEAEMIRAAGLDYAASSNLVYGNLGIQEVVAQEAVDSWVNSAGHLKTMLSNRDNTGVGVAKLNNNGGWVCVQFFGLKSSSLGTYA